MKRHQWRSWVLSIGGLLCLGLLFRAWLHFGARHEAFPVDGHDEVPSDVSTSSPVTAEASHAAMPAAPQAPSDPNGSKASPGGASASTAGQTRASSGMAAGPSSQSESATKNRPLSLAGPTHKDWNHAESVGPGQTQDVPAKLDPKEQALRDAIEALRFTVVADQKEWQRKLLNADASEKEDIRKALMSNRDAFIARQKQLREELRQLINSRE